MLICSQRGPLIKQALHLLVQTVVRVALPVVIREFIRWLAAEDEGSARGWTMAGAVIALSIISLVVYHKVFWCEPMAKVANNNRPFQFWVALHCRAFCGAFCRWRVQAALACAANSYVDGFV